MVYTDAAEDPRHLKSAADLDTYLSTTPSTPLDVLSADARQNFLSSMVFSAKGLASFNYTDLATLSSSQITDILRLFGVERTTPLVTHARVSPEGDTVTRMRDDHDGYWCSSAATCTKLAGNICTSNC